MKKIILTKNDIETVIEILKYAEFENPENEDYVRAVREKFDKALKSLDGNPEEIYRSI